MAKTIVGLFDTVEEAQRVVQDLVNDGIGRDRISIAANDTKGETKSTATTTEGGTTGEHAAAGAATGAVTGGLVGGGLGLVLSIIGATAIPVIGPIIAAGPIVAALTGAGVGAAAGGLLGALTGAGVPEEDAHFYAEGVSRGGTLVTVAADDDKAQDAYDIMQRHGAVDIDERGATYRQEGWKGYDTNAQPYTAEQVETHRTAVRSAAPQTRDMNQGQAVLPVVEEQLEVGKRQVQRGGVRIYNQVSEKPVEAQVQLREEQINVERRPVDRAVSANDQAAFQQGAIEVTETDEVPVVNKQARVVEEVVVDKTAQERTETVKDTVRRTDVEVEKLTDTQTTRDNSGRDNRSM